jgi:hypothetical protein
MIYIFNHYLHFMEYYNVVLRDLQNIIEENERHILEVWHEHFDN